MAAAQRPSVVGAELADAADSVTSAVSGVPGDQWMRRGLRSNGSVFTVESLGRHLLHDLAHHGARSRLRAVCIDLAHLRPGRGRPTVRAVDFAHLVGRHTRDPKQGETSRRALGRLTA